MDFLAACLIVLFSFGIFVSGMFIMTQYSIDMIEYILSDEHKHTFFINSSIEIRFYVIWGIIAAIMFVVGIFIVILSVI